jgi:hypothetical protein
VYSLPGCLLAAGGLKGCFRGFWSRQGCIIIFENKELNFNTIKE